MRRPSLETRLVLLQLGLSAAVIAIFAVSAAWFSARTLTHDEDRWLAEGVRQMQSSLTREWGEENDLALAARAVIEESAPPDLGVTILDERWHVVASNGVLAGAPAGATKRREVHLARGAWIVVTASTATRVRAMTALVTALVWVSIPLFLATLITSRAMARRALAPVSRMTRQAGAASRIGALQPLGSADDPAEVAALAGAFNQLVARLEAMLRTERHFVEDAAHELRTPLAVITGELEHAVADPGLAEPQRQALGQAWVEARRMGELVEALLLLRRAEGMTMADEDGALPVNLADVAREVTAACVRERPERRGDVSVTSADEVLVRGHATLLAAAVRNLVDNALKFTSPGQPVEVAVIEGREVSVLVVEDGGPGIPPEDAERIFDPFFRSRGARAEKTGFGLGLPLLRRVARAHGGDIVVARAEPGGARFELRLPVWRRAPAS